MQHAIMRPGEALSSQPVTAADMLLLLLLRPLSWFDRIATHLHLQASLQLRAARCECRNCGLQLVHLARSLHLSCHTQSAVGPHGLPDGMFNGC